MPDLVSLSLHSLEAIVGNPPSGRPDRLVRVSRSRLEELLGRAGGNPNHEPAGSPTGGQFTSGGAGSDSEISAAIDKIDSMDRYTITGMKSEKGPDIKVPLEFSATANEALKKLDIKLSDFNGPPIRLAISSLVALQDQVSAQRVIDILRAKSTTSTDSIKIVEYGGKNYLWDGTHRAVALKLLGRHDVIARKFIVDAESVLKP
jgi:hypothetical protein